MVKQINNYLTEKKSLFQTSIRKTYERFLKIRGTPREIALGFALGLFVGMSPTMGFQMAIAVFLAALFKLNKISAAAAVWITNPVTAPIIYGMTYFVGAHMIGMPEITLTPEAFSVTSFITFFKQTPRIFWAMTLGGVVIGVPVAIAGYVMVHSAVDKYQRDIRQKLTEKKQQMAARRQDRKSRKKNKKKGRRGGIADNP
ncbi:MAG: DUF2062 domain-containing protein [Pseudomonadota bacterium]